MAGPKPVAYERDRNRRSDTSRQGRAYAATMDPLRTAWVASGSPPATQTSGLGACARCLTDAPLTPVGRVVSENFTAYDSWAHPAGRGLCAACAWAYTTPALRNTSHRVDREPGHLQPLDRPATFAVLRRGPLTLDTALAVPLRAGRKHVLPLAKWGNVQVDEITLTWSSSDAARLGHVAALRIAGAPRAAFFDKAPPHRILKPAGTFTLTHAHDLWNQLTPWRDSPPWMQLALHVT